MNTEKKYKELEFYFGDIDSAIKELKSHKELACISFNGQMLYSDIDDIDPLTKRLQVKLKRNMMPT